MFLDQERVLYEAAAHDGDMPSHQFGNCGFWPEKLCWTVSRKEYKSVSKGLIDPTLKKRRCGKYDMRCLKTGKESKE